MLTRCLKLGAVAATLVAAGTALSGCEANQITWNEHSYAISSSCAPLPLTVGSTTLHNGTGTVGSTRIQIEKVYYGDITHDGVLDAVVLLGCSDAFGGNATGTEIQVFTRDAKPVARLIEPDAYTVNAFGSQFNRNNIGIHSNLLYTGAYRWLPGDAHCCPSAYAVYRWDWNGHDFTPVQVPW